ncbi:MAG: SPFH domain-containing protein [Cyclobacteriaceae bacterium]
MSGSFIIIIGAVAVFIFILLIGLFQRYKRCPSDRILVIYGKVGKGSDDLGRSARCIHGGAAFIWPIIQDYEFLNLTPISIEVGLTNALSRQNIRVDVPSRFTVGISTEEGIMLNAAERLLGLSQENVHDLAKDIIFGQLRLVVATMDIEEINNNRDKFLANVASNVEAELKKIGLKLINVNVTDIKDESGYIEALGKEAAAKAINDAKKSVAEKDRDGAIGEANAVQDQRVQVASANASAVEGENTAKITIANSDAARREKEAEAQKIAIAAEKVQTAKALEEAYAAEQEAENARARRDKSSQTADIVIPAQIDKERVEIAAEAQAENIRRIAKGEADAILFKKQAEAKGIFEVLTKQAEGFKEIVKAAGSNSRDAVLLIIADKMDELVRLQTEAIKNIKIDKVTVWDSGSSGEGDKTSTANFISGLYKSVPPLQEMFDMAGMELPEYLKGKSAEQIKAEAKTVRQKSTPKKPKPGQPTSDSESTED